MGVLLLQVNWQNFENSIGGEKASSILWCVIIIVATLLLKKSLARILARLSARITGRYTDKKHGKTFESMVLHPLEMLLQTGLFYLAANQLSILLGRFVMHRYEGKREILAVRFGDIVDHLFLFFIIFYFTIVLVRILDFIYYVQMEKAHQEHNKGRQQLLPLAKEVAKVLIWTFGLFWVLGTVFHVNIPALITGLGIGGVAIALAAKESVENLFAAFTILGDKPFETGDKIRLGTLEGTVERVGLRSTRVRSSDGSAFIIPNKKLVGENLENLSARSFRKIKLVVNVKYLPHEALQKVIAELSHKIEHTLYVIGNVDVAVEGFGENVFQLLVSYNVQEPLDADANLNTIKYSINMLIYETIERYSGSTNAVTSISSAPDNPETPEAEQPEEEKKDDSII